MDNQKPLPVFDAPPSRKSVASSTRTSAQFTAQPREEVVLPVFDVLPPQNPIQTQVKQSFLNPQRNHTRKYLYLSLKYNHLQIQN
ncbi:hypothetical protein NQ315_014334 [Exocentrus adspersus]|uniref:Uncharacterized protein n=1 Tax=Exocentrus adspersus TaxID=1586481 RepID=A0AAV8VLI6_9CUCU|nr:hypothetical protein NQ315_014334 [Exocentrus adspersus]